MQILVIFMMILLIISLISQIEQIKKKPKEYFNEKINEFFIVSVKDKQKIATTELDNGNQPKSTWRNSDNRNYESCYSTQTKNGNKTGRMGPYNAYCNQGIDGSEVIPHDGLYNLDFSNYNIYYGKGIRGIPMTGQINLNNGIAYILNNEGIIQNETPTLSQSKMICDSMKDKCLGFITIIPVKGTFTSKTIFISKLEKGFEDPDTYSKLLNVNEVSYNIISYVKKNPDYIEKSVSDNVFKNSSDTYKNQVTCNWKSADRCIFKDYTYNQSRDLCINNNNNQNYTVSEINQYNNSQISEWLSSRANRDIGADKRTSDESNVREYINRCKEIDGFEFLSQVGLPKEYVPTTKPGDVKGRYVRISINDRDPNRNWLQLAEVQIINNNKNIALGKNTSSSGNYPGSSNSKANDGNNDGNWNNGNVFVSNNDMPHHPGSPQFWEVDLGDASQTIDRIIVSNRTDCCRERLNNWLLSIYNNDRKLIWARIYANPPEPRVIIDIKASDNDMNNNRVKDYEQNRFNKYFNRVSNTEFNSKQGRNSDCSEECHKDICIGEKKKWIGNNNFFGCRDYKPGELEAELAEKARLEEEIKLGFKESDYLTKEQKAVLRSWLPPKSKITLIYKGSRDGMNNNAFRSKVEGKGATITILKNSHGHTFGAYTSKDWNLRQCYLPDTDAFLFSLDNNQKFENSVSQYSLCNYNTYGPTFGGGHDLMIFGWNYNGNNCYHYPHSYNYRGYRLTTPMGDGGRWNWDTQMFRVIWIETYQVTKTN